MYDAIIVIFCYPRRDAGLCCSCYVAIAVTDYVSNEMNKHCVHEAITVIHYVSNKMYKTVLHPLWCMLQKLCLLRIQ